MENSDAKKRQEEIFHQNDNNKVSNKNTVLLIVLGVVVGLSIGVGLVFSDVFESSGREDLQVFVQEPKEKSDTPIAKSRVEQTPTDNQNVHLYTDAKSLQEGMSLFEKNCVACHGQDGGGGIGPNHTDEYWINGGGFDNIYHTISEGGRPGKGMVPWKTYFRPIEIAKLASYVISLNGTSPESPKDPEGDIIWTKDVE